LVSPHALRKRALTGCSLDRLYAAMSSIPMSRRVSRTHPQTDLPSPLRKKRLGALGGEALQRIDISGS